MSFIESIVSVVSSFGMKNLSLTVLFATVLLPAVTVTLFCPVSALSIGTLNVPLESVVTSWTTPLIVTLTGRFASGLPFLSVTLPVIFAGSSTLMFSGMSIDIMVSMDSTFTVLSAIVLLYLSVPLNSILTSFVPTVLVGNDMLKFPSLSVLIV